MQQQEMCTGPTVAHLYKFIENVKTCVNMYSRLIVYGGIVMHANTSRK